MSDKKKPGFFDGLFEGMATDDSAESPELSAAKDYIQKLKLSSEDQVSLSGWLMGQGLKTQIASALGVELPD